MSNRVGCDGVGGRASRLRRGAVLPYGLILVVSLVAAGCAQAPEPVARLEVGADSLVLPHGGWVDVELSWFPLRELGGFGVEPVVFVHLLDQGGTLVRTFDGPYPHRWEPGVERSQKIYLSQSALASPLVPGAYSLTLGLYDPASGSRWPLAVEAGLAGRHEYAVAAVEIPGEVAGVSFSVDGDVLEAELGTDLQVLTRIGLTGPAEIRVDGAEVPGVVLLELAVDELAPAMGGADPGSVMVTGSCGCPAAVVTDAGRSLLVLPLSLEDGPGSCVLRLARDDPMLVAMALDRRIVSIAGMSWRPGS